MTDIEKTASALTPNMVRSLTWWCHDGRIGDIDNSTKRALVKRGLTTWASGECLDLTELGQQVREVLLVRAKAEEEAKAQVVAREEAKKWEFRDAGYKDGHRVGQAECVTDLNRAVYGCDTWPDRPLDSVWEHLLDLVRKHFLPDAEKDATSVAPSEAIPE